MNSENSGIGSCYHRREVPFAKRANKERAMVDCSTIRVREIHVMRREIA
jgi:hypothetical protein